MRTIKKLSKNTNEMPAGDKKDEALEEVDDYKQFICLHTGEMATDTIKDAMKLVKCANVEGFYHPKWQCVLGKCDPCPDYNDSIPKHEKQMEQSETTAISFNVYEAFTKCSAHLTQKLELNAKTCPQCEAFEPGKKKGTIRTKKELTWKMEPIGVFHETYMKPAAKDLAYHLPYISMLGK
jgi:hypothetical protein